MATYLVDACLPKLELFAGKDSKNSGIFLIGPNSHKNRITVEIGAQNKQTEVNGGKKITHAPARALEGVLRAAFYARVSTRFFLCSRRSRRVGLDRSERSRAVRFACGAPVRTRADPVAHA